MRVKNLATIQRALKRFGSEEARRLDRELIEGGKIVVGLADREFALIDPTEPSRFTSKTKGFGRVVVTRTRSRGKRGDFGALLMVRALLPARAEATDQIIDHIDGMLGRLAGEEGF